MEITTTQPGRPWRATAGRLLVGGVLLVALLLLPAAFDLHPRGVSTDAGGTYARGWLVLAEPVVVEELADGDVVLAEVSEPDGKMSLVARTVSDFDAEWYVSSPGGDTHRWSGVRQQRVALAIPYLGYPAVLPGAATLLLGVALALALAVRSWRRAVRRRVPDPLRRTQLEPSPGSPVVAGRGCVVRPTGREAAYGPPTAATVLDSRP